MSLINRCDWCTSDADYIQYHDLEWGEPNTDDQALFELLILESFQAGLSWLTILKKRENFRKAMDSFDANKMANYKEDKIQELLQNKGIIRHRKKIEASIKNAKAYLEVRRDYPSFSYYLWSFVDHQPIINQLQSMEEVPNKTLLSIALAKSLKQHGFSFMGPTTCYAFMQASGMVNDHLVDCFKHPNYSVHSQYL